MVKPVKIHDNNLWDKFVSDSEQYFAVLSPGTKIAFFVGENYWMMQASFQLSLKRAS